jgi:UDP-N-acetyl-D-mannosaminuronic acid dehydrogenase
MAEYDICVIGGAGHVGLPLSIALADKGKRVAIYDINKKGLETIEGGKMPFLEEGAETVLRKVIKKTLFVSDNPDTISRSEFVVVIIGTPVDEHLNPSFSVMKRFLDGIIPRLRNGQIIILRSTVFPGITDKIRHMLKSADLDIEIVFCPERILEGKAMEELYSLPQIVAGFDDGAIKKASDLFSLLTGDIIVTTPLEAELTKLFANTWRYIQFATANQFYMIAEEYGADFYSIFNAMTYNYPRTKTFPKPGYAAGPCLFKDTMQLSAFTQNNFFLGHSAMLVNEGLPNFIVAQAKKKHDLRSMRVGVLGMAFKGESDDIRESLSYKLKKLLEIESKEVLCSDEYVKDGSFISAEELIDRCDLIVIGAPHKRYKTLDYKNRVLIDVWDHAGK